jgi:hypothetical protein
MIPTSFHEAYIELTKNPIIFLFLVYFLQLLKEFHNKLNVGTKHHPFNGKANTTTFGSCIVSIPTLIAPTTTRSCYSWIWNCNSTWATNTPSDGNIIK